MPAWDTDDLAALLDEDMPGYAEATIGAATVEGLYTAPYAVALGGMVGGNSPTFRARTSDLAAVSAGTALTVGGISYTVAEKQVGPLGHTLLTLETA